jgi:acyl-CoA synthetase (AMP-forming)/AMP-acid ligase II
MRRSLVLTDEAARHPFLASLPPHVRRIDEPVPRRRGRGRIMGLSMQDLREFLMAYCACLMAAAIFIA